MHNERRSHFDYCAGCRGSHGDDRNHIRRERAAHAPWLIILKGTANALLSLMVIALFGTPIIGLLCFRWMMRDLDD